MTGLTPSPGIRATLLLADYAAVADGKLYISGGGWSVTGPGPVASAIALKLDVPWNMTNQKMKLELRLVTGDGEPVTQETAAGDHRPIVIEGEFEVGRPPGLVPGTAIDVPVAIVVPPLPLPPGSRFTWYLAIDGKQQNDWRLDFSTRPAM